MSKLSFSPKSIIFLTLFIVFFCYCLYQARFLIIGPRLSVETPRDEAIVLDSVITVAGKAMNAARLSLNGRQIYTTEDGRWSERLIVSEGLSIISISARDRFGRETDRVIRVIRN